MLPRPRRFGKTLNLSIIKYFFEKSDEDRKYLFENLKIEKETEIMKKQGKYPLIYITFKDDKQRSFNNFIEIFRFKISDIYSKFMVLMDELSEQEKSYFNDILFRRASVSQLEVSILKLSEHLNKYYNQKVIILIDEYDTPIHHAYFEGYYDEMIGFIRNFLSSALKDNINLEKAMITGILRVAKESIFSGLNNLEVHSILGEKYSNKFGFTEEETMALLKEHNLDQYIDSFKKWYNGYLFGSTTIYNPWSVLSYINKPDRYFMPYWVNTSENKIIKTLLAKGDEENEVLIYKLAIPNAEIKRLYRNIIDKWFIEGYVSNDYNNMLKALTLGDIELFEEYFSMYMLNSFSYFDVSGNNPERVYHAFVLGMLVSLSQSHEVVSNRESGLGRYDVSLIPKDKSKPGIIMEFKSLRINSKRTLEDAMEKAVEQVNKKLYETELVNKGIEHIIKIAMVFKGKEVLLKEVK